MRWEIIEQNILALLAGAIAFLSSWAVFKHKLEALEKRVDKIDGLKMDVKLAAIEAKLEYIQALLERER